MSENLELRVRFKALGDLAKKFEGIRAKATGLTKAVDKLKTGMASTAGELNYLSKVERTAARYSGLRDKMKGDTLALTELREKSRRLEQQLKQTVKPTQKLRNEFLRARKETTRLEEKHRSHYSLLNRLQKELKSAGFDAGKFAKSESELKSKIERTTKALADQANQLDKVREKRKKLDALKSRADSLMRGGMGAAKYGAAAGITGGLAIGGGLAAVDRATKSQVETQMLAKSVQVNVEFLQGMSAAVRPAGFNQDNIVDLVEELNNKMGESVGVEQMSAVTDSLKILGLNYERIKKLAPEQQFRAITDAAMAMSDQQQAASAVDMLMGGEANKLLGVLKQTGGSTEEILSNFKALNMQTEQSRKGAMAYQLQMAKVKTLASGLSAEFFGVLGGALAPALKRLTDWVKTNESLVQSKVVSAATQLAGALVWIVENMSSIVTWTKRIAIGFAVFFSVMAALKGYITVVTAFNLAAGSGIGVFSLLKTTLGGVGKAAMFMGRLVMAAGRLMLANPIILAVTLLATAAYLIYKNWEPIKAFFITLWDGITDRFNKFVGFVQALWNGLVGWINAIPGRMLAFFTSLPARYFELFDLVVSQIKLSFGKALDWFGGLKERFFGFGSAIVDGLLGGLTSRLGALKNTVVGVGGSIATWFKKSKVEINSPSRLFKKYGGFISQGLELGILGRVPSAVAAIRTLGARTTQAFKLQGFDYSAAAYASSDSLENPRLIIDISARLSELLGTGLSLTLPGQIRDSADDTESGDDADDAPLSAKARMRQLVSDAQDTLLNLGMDIVQGWTADLGKRVFGGSALVKKLLGLAGGLGVKSEQGDTGDQPGYKAQNFRSGFRDTIDRIKSVVFSTGSELVKEWLEGRYKKAFGSSSTAELILERLKSLSPGLSSDKRIQVSTAGVQVSPDSALTQAPSQSARESQNASAAEHYTFNIYPAPGMDERALARMVAAEIERIERRKDARKNSRLYDD